MVKVSMEVRSGAAHFDVGVRAESIQRAMSFVKGTILKGQRSGEVPDRARELLCGESHGSRRDSWPGASRKGGSVRY
jgi:hypothetical protein